MSHDPARIADTREWLARAAGDLAAGGHGMRASPPFAGDAAFHAQQAAEKALKGFLTWHDEPFRKTHNLTELGKSCVGLDASLEPLVRTASRLTEYAWKFRYPGEPEAPPAEEARGALAVARSVYETILARLPEEARP